MILEAMIAIQMVIAVVLLIRLIRELGRLHAEVAEVKKLSAREFPQCNFYPQEMPTIKEIHKVVEKTTQQEFMAQQYKRVAEKYNNEK